MLNATFWGWEGVGGPKSRMRDALAQDASTMGHNIGTSVDRRGEKKVVALLQVAVIYAIVRTSIQDHWIASQTATPFRARHTLLAMWLSRHSRHIRCSARDVLSFSSSVAMRGIHNARDHLPSVQPCSGRTSTSYISPPVGIQDAFEVEDCGSTTTITNVTVDQFQKSIQL